jgi:hypothetical protein
MRRLERCAAAAAALWVFAAAVSADEPLFSHRAPVTIEQPAPFVHLPLPTSAYANSTQPGLQDLRVVDARGERVPFALLAPRADATEAAEQQRDATLYPLPPRPPGSTAAWPAPVDVRVDGDRITVRRRAPEAAGTSRGPSPGWLIDLGERRRDAPAPQSLKLAWSGPAEFSAVYTFEQSDDLRQWRPGGRGQVMALASPAGPLTQPTVVLPAAPARFVRLVWADVASAPTLTGARVVSALPRQVTLDAPSEIVVAPGAEPAGKHAADADAKRALHFDLGAPVPIERVDLRLAAGTQVAPVRLQSRTQPDAPWQALAGAVFYRLERDGAVATSPPLAVQARARYLRVVVDERAALPDAAQTRLVVAVRLSSIVFASQGEPPYALLAGSPQAPAGALPIATLVPGDLADERLRFGRAALGAWSEVDAAMRQAESERRRAALRPWLLWAVLVLGVAGLAVMVWRLARGGPAEPPPA